MSTGKHDPKPAATPRLAAGRIAPRPRGSPAPAGKDHIASLAKGLGVLSAFSEDRPSMSLTEAAAVVGLSRAAARRVLLTLAELGYVTQSGREFAPSPLVLELGFSYLSVQSWAAHVEPLMRTLSAELGEASFAATLHRTEIVVVARGSAPSPLSSTMAIGTRLPAFHTAMGRIQLGFLTEDEIWSRLRTSSLRPYTASTILDPSALVERVRSDVAQGFSIVDEELENGFRAIAVAVTRRDGSPVGAVDISAHSSRTTRSEMREHYLPKLQALVARISEWVV